jgi:hypothetical protein
MTSNKDLLKGILYGVAGTTATLAAFIYYRRNKGTRSMMKLNNKDDNDDEEEEEYSSDEDQTEDLPQNILDIAPKDWGVLHAPFKMLLCVNQELYDENGKPKKMTHGKVAAQCCHATLGAYKRGKCFLSNETHRTKVHNKKRVT